jgi:hypothetical protein
MLLLLALQRSLLPSGPPVRRLSLPPLAATLHHLALKISIEIERCLRSPPARNKNLLSRENVRKIIFSSFLYSFGRWYAGYSAEGRASAE